MFTCVLTQDCKMHQYSNCVNAAAHIVGLILLPLSRIALNSQTNKRRKSQTNFRRFNHVENARKYMDYLFGIRKFGKTLWDISVNN